MLPFSKSVRGNDGSEMYQVLVPKGTMVFTSLLSSNRNPDLWGPDSYEWKPERWIEGLPGSVTGAKLPGVYSHLYVLLP
jgi:cytochrome P450